MIYTFKLQKRADKLFLAIDNEIAEPEMRFYAGILAEISG
jgi:hypothetical protein